MITKMMILSHDKHSQTMTIICDSIKDKGRDWYESINDLQNIAHHFNLSECRGGFVIYVSNIISEAEVSFLLNCVQEGLPLQNYQTVISELLFVCGLWFWLNFDPKNVR